MSKENNISEQQVYYQFKIILILMIMKDFVIINLKFYAQNYDEYETCENGFLITEKDFNEKYCSQFISHKKK